MFNILEDIRNPGGKVVVQQYSTAVEIAELRIAQYQAIALPVYGLKQNAIAILCIECCGFRDFRQQATDAYLQAGLAQDIGERGKVAQIIDIPRVILWNDQ